MFRYLDKSSGYLFASHDLRQVLEGQKIALRKEVDALDPNRLLNTAPTDLAAYLVEKYQVDAPILHRDKWSVEE